MRERKDMKRYIEDVENLCRKYTSLSAEEIRVIKRAAEDLKMQVEIEKKDVFINCLCKDNSGAVTVALAHCDDNLYDISTIGLIIREEEEPAVLRTLRYGVVSRDMWAVSYTTTEGNRIVQTCAPIQYHGKTIGVYTIERRLKQSEIDEWSREEDFLVIDYNRYPYLKYLDWLAECVSEAVIICDEDGVVVFRNSEAKSLYHKYGYIFDIYQKRYEEVSMHGPLKVGRGIENAFYQSEQKCGSYYFHIKQYCYCAEETWFYIVLLQDVTQDRLKDETLVSKSAALREAHHRIKNNLQTVYNLLDMQWRRLDSADSAVAIKEAMGRIMSISTAYEVLLLKGLDQVSIRDIIETVRAKFIQIMEGVLPKVEICIYGDDVCVDADCATNVALVVYELVQNSFKHAFKGRKTGNIGIQIIGRPVYSEVTVFDDGIGFCYTEDRKEFGGMGFQIAKNIVRSKLKGELRCESDRTGTRVTFDFRHYEN